ARRSGFSIAEVLLVLTILGIVAGFAVPAVSRSVDQTRIDRAAFLLATDLENAFTLAARQKAPVRITVNTSALSYVFSDRQTNGVMVERNMGPASIYGLSSLSSSGTVDVFPNGLASSQVTFTLTTAHNTRTVTMSRAGQVRIQAP